MRCARTWLLLAVFAVGGCSSDSDSESSFACRYSLSTQTVCTGYSNFDTSDGCYEVSSQERCDDLTDSSNDCTGDCCSSFTYTNVSLESGSCSDETPPDSDPVDGDPVDGDPVDSDPIDDGPDEINACEIGEIDDACSSCTKQQCCGFFEECAFSTSCQNFLDCFADCETDACLDGCIDAELEGSALFFDLFFCASDSCPACG